MFNHTYLICSMEEDEYIEYFCKECGEYAGDRMYLCEACIDSKEEE